LSKSFIFWLSASTRYLQIKIKSAR